MKIFENLKKNEFIINLTPLFLGTSSAQVILLFTSPILTRIFSPENFGVFVIYQSILSILLVIASMRYELSIMLPKKDSDSLSLFFLSFFIVLILSLFLLMSLIIILLIIEINNLEAFFYLVPGLFLAGFYQILVNWNNRKSNFKIIAFANLVQTFFISFFQIIFGLLGFFSQGLIIGSLMGFLFSIFIFIRKKLFLLSNIIKKIKFNSIVQNGKDFREFPLFSLPGALINSISLQAPVFWVSTFFGQATTGFYGLALRVVYLPIVLLSAPVFQVTYKKISDLDNERPEEIRSYVFNKILALFLFTIPFPILFIFFSEEIFSFIFGYEWIKAGEYSKYLVFLAYIKFCASPAMAVFNLKRNIKSGALWQFFYFVSLCIFLMILYLNSASMEIFLVAIVIHEFCQNLILLLLTYVKTSYSRDKHEF